LNKLPWALPLICLYLALPPVMAFEYGLAPHPELRLDATSAGASPTHHLSFQVSAGELETYRARITYPDAFRFNGFDILGPAHTLVGVYQLDLNFDGSPDVTVELRSFNRNTAYADVLADQAFSLDLEPTLTHTGGTDFLLHLPFGGDADTDTRVAPFSARVTLSLFHGLLTSPEARGDYAVKVRFTSVNPDTDGFNDGANAEPMTLAFELPVQINGSLVCDIDTNGDVDSHDINAINAARNTLAAPGDPRDVNGDGKINVLDARYCVTKCTRPRCATR
jgi:hypothetical protein